MENKVQKTVIATHGSVAAGDGGCAAGRDILITNQYLENKGVRPFKIFRGNPTQPLKEPDSGVISVNDLREDLLLIDDPLEKLPHPTPVSIRGMLYPCGLLVSGWWTRQHQGKIEIPKWNNEIQAWLFHGFHEWGPSWDFTWNFENDEDIKAKPYLIAQLGDGDEANSIPVVIPQEKAKRLYEIFLEEGSKLGMKMAGAEVEIKALLTHRMHFTDQELEKFDLQQADILNFCIWLKEGEAKHKIILKQRSSDIYSGYLWKLIAPQKATEVEKTISLNC